MKLSPFTHRLRELCADRNLAVGDLARKAQITHQYASMLLGGTRSCARRDMLQRLAQALEVTVGELLEPPSRKIKHMPLLPRGRRQKTGA